MNDDKLKAVRERLVEIRHSLQFADENPGGGIHDTIWMMHSPETVFDALDATIAMLDAEPASKPEVSDAKERAWQSVRQQVGTEGWTTSDACTYYGFFDWGWRCAKSKSASDAPAQETLYKKVRKPYCYCYPADPITGKSESYWHVESNEGKTPPDGWSHIDYTETYEPFSFAAPVAQPAQEPDYSEPPSAENKVWNALMWMYRRMKPTYGRLPFVEEAIAEAKDQDEDKWYAEILRTERDHARAMYADTANILTSIHSLLYPPKMTGADGITYMFNAPDPHKLIQALSDQIRAIPEKLAAHAPASDAPAQEPVTRYCETCEQNVTSPCSSWECATPEFATTVAQPAAPMTDEEQNFVTWVKNHRGSWWREWKRTQYKPGITTGRLLGSAKTDSPAAKAAAGQEGGAA